MDKAQHPNVDLTIQNVAKKDLHGVSTKASMALGGWHKVPQKACP